jgi:putative ABC transport system permease protein
MKPSPPSPPQWMDRFLEWFCDEELLEEIQGDLHEAYAQHCQAERRWKAQLLYFLDVFSFFKPYAFEKYSRAKQFIPMFDNYLKVALRNIFHRKGFTAINLLGLSIGISTVMLIGFYLKHEVSYDQNFPDHQRIFRLMNQHRDQAYSPIFFKDYNQSTQETQLRLVNHLSGYPEVEQACHFVPSHSDIGGRDAYYLESEGEKWIAERVLYTNTGLAFQALFPQTFLLGSPEAAFSTYNRIVITEPLAEKWFGPDWQEQDLIGKTFTIRGTPYTLGGVVSRMPTSSHFDFDWLVYQQRIPSWGAYTYFKLTESASLSQVMDKLKREIDLVFPGYTEDVLQKGLSAVKLADIHFTKDALYELKPIANRNYLLTFGTVAIMILLIIWINYTNLSVAMYASRKKELEVRKILGARSRDIAFQLLSEAVLLTSLCFPICWLLIANLSPHFFQLMGISLSHNPIYAFGPNFALLALLVFSGLMSGIYPAIIFSRGTQRTLFPSRFRTPWVRKKVTFRNVLLISQFSLVIGLLSMTYFVYQQIVFVEDKDLGFDQEGVVFFGVDGREKYDQLRASLSQFPEIESIAANGVPGAEMYNQLTYKMKGAETTLADGTQQAVEYNTFKTLKISCEACATLDAGKSEIFVINETAARKLARTRGIEPYDLIGQTLVMEPEWENETFGFGIPHTIDGIVKDYKYFSLKYPHQSLLITVSREAPWVESMLLKVNTPNWEKLLEKVRTAYQEVESIRPFDPQFLEDRLKRLYLTERRSGMLIGGLSIIATLLALMGLAGIVSFLSVSRQKEIGIRKVLGATEGNILLSFNREMLSLLLLSMVIASPLALYAATRWLENFAFKIQPSLWVIALSGWVTALLIALMVTAWSWKAANQNPVEVLRTD